MQSQKPIVALNLLLPEETDRASKDLRSRVMSFITWAIENGYSLDNLGLAAYREHLQTERGYADTTVKAHLATIRGWINTQLDNGTIPQAAKDYADKQLPAAERATFVEGYIARVRAAIAPSTSRVTVSPPPRRNIKLNEDDINQLLFRLDPSTPPKLRDTAVILFITCLGLRPNEISALTHETLRHEVDGHLTLHIPPGRGCTERYIPYGEYEWILEVIDLWLKEAEIEDGPVFRGFYKGGHLLRDDQLSGRAIEQLLGNYPIDLRGELVILKPLDLRHAYARHLYRTGLDLETLRQRLGLKSLQTVLDYIGDVDAGMYDPQARFVFDFDKLAIWQEG